jgi:hypothetical protein
MENQRKDSPHFRGFVRYDLSIARDGVSSSQNYQREILDLVLALGWIVDSGSYRDLSIEINFYKRPLLFQIINLLFFVLTSYFKSLDL